MANITKVADYTDTGNNTVFNNGGIAIDVGPSVPKGKLVCYVVTATSAAARSLVSVVAGGSKNITGGADGTNHKYDGGTNGRFIGIFWEELTTELTRSLEITFSGAMTHATIHTFYVTNYQVPAPHDIKFAFPGVSTNQITVDVDMVEGGCALLGVVNRTAATWTLTTSAEDYDAAIESQSNAIGTTDGPIAADATYTLGATPSVASSTRILMGVSFGGRGIPLFYMGSIADLANLTTYTGGVWDFNVNGADVPRDFIIAVEGGISGNTISSVAGGAASQIIQSVDGAGTAVAVGLFRLRTTPSAGIISLPVVWSGAQTHCYAQVWEILSPFTLIDSDVSVADPQDVTLNSAPGGFAIAAAAQRAVTPVDPVWGGTGVIEDYDSANVETNDRFTAASVLTTGASQNINCDTTTDTRRVMVAASFFLGVAAPPRAMRQRMPTAIMAR